MCVYECLVSFLIIYFTVATSLIGFPFADVIVLESSAAPAVQPGAVHVSIYTYIYTRVSIHLDLVCRVRAAERPRLRLLHASRGVPYGHAPSPSFLFPPSLPFTLGSLRRRYSYRHPLSCRPNAAPLSHLRCALEIMTRPRLGNEERAVLSSVPGNRMREQRYHRQCSYALSFLYS